MRQEILGAFRKLGAPFWDFNHKVSLCWGCPVYANSQLLPPPAPQPRVQHAANVGSGFSSSGSEDALVKDEGSICHVNHSATVLCTWIDLWPTFPKVASGTEFKAHGRRGPDGSRAELEVQSPRIWETLATVSLIKCTNGVVCSTSEDWR